MFLNLLGILMRESVVEHQPAKAGCMHRGYVRGYGSREGAAAKRSRNSWVSERETHCTTGTILA